VAKEWILNSATNRFQLNFKRNVGAVSEAIRKCAPKTADAWRGYYFANVRPQAHIKDLGRKLYTKIKAKVNGKKEIVNIGVIVDIQNEIARLSQKPTKGLSDLP
jgi:hypothetical protein